MKVSVIVLMYNSQKTLVRCIKSLLAQTYSEFELVFVDDNSKDKSVAIVESYDDPRIVLVKNEKNYGIAKSRNVGLRHSTGDLIFFTDSDCLPSRTWLEQGVNNIKDNDIITGWTFYENPRPSLKDRVVVGKNDFFTCNLGFKKSALDRVNGFDEKFAMYAEDKDVCFRIIKSGGKTTFCPSMVVVHQTIERSPRGELRRYANYYQGKLNSEIRYGKESNIFWRIIRPEDLIKIIFPPSLLLIKPITSFKDVKVLPFVWLGFVIGRIHLWKESFKAKKFYI